MCRYGELVSRVSIVKPCDSAFVAVPSAAPKASRLGHSPWPQRSSVGTVFIASHLGIIAGISADDGSTMGALTDAYPVVEHPDSTLVLETCRDGGESDGARATG